ncbi:MAG: GNAT family N-acetyltransferase [Oscillospiraceae bacterium]|jgi:RimJ/RimL family protein N-acetyltransferase/GNAT superfamily N-acetyltransferase|nr:GNAT family N-acetyltransferase [Oscillospiraceae bacterium]
MYITNSNLCIRNAVASDAEQLCAWWNDGAIMAHAGFPNGVGDTPERIRESLAGDNDGIHRRHIIELAGTPIGEMNYRNKGDSIAEIGIKICAADEREKSYGTILLSMFIDVLFRYFGYEKIILDTNVKNTRAQHVYEHKLGFRKLSVRENSWTDQLDVPQSSIDYDLSKADWLAAHPQIEYFRFVQVESPDEKSAICENILRMLPNWFSVEKSIVNYVKEVRELPFCAAFSGDAAVGFVALKPHNEYTAEVCVMGVLQDFHRHGIGRQLIALCIEECRRAGRLFLTVKTLDQSRESRSYEKTRLFYQAQGFYPLEVFPLLWDENNPCLFMAKYLGGATE